MRRRWTEDDVAVGLHRLAAELGEPEPRVDANQVSKWERGVRSPGRFYRPRLCLVFECTPEELDFISTPRLLEEIGVLAQRRLERLEPRREDGHLRSVGPTETAFPDMDRERLATTLRHLWPVDGPLLAGIERAGRELIRRSDIEPPALIAPDMREFRAALMTLLSRSQPESMTGRLQTLASELSRSIAWLSDHTRHWPETYSNYALAEALAREAGNGNQLAQVLVNKSEMYSGRATRPEDLDTAEELADGAAVVIGPDALAGLKGWVLGVRATHAAARGDETTAFRYLDYAYRLAAAAPGEMNLFSDYDSAWLDSYRAAVVLRLRPAEAISIFEAVLDRTAPELTWERVSALNHLAEAHAAERVPDIERVCELLRESVELAHRTGDERGLTLASQLRNRHLAPWRTDRHVRELDEAIRAARR